MPIQLPPIPSNAGLAPAQQLAQWNQWRQQVEAMPGWEEAVGAGSGRITPEMKYYNGPNPRAGDARFTGPEGVYSESFTPDAEQMFNNAKTHFDTKKGEVVKNKGYWSQPESWIQLGLGGALAGAGAAGLLPGALGGGTAGGGSSASAMGGAAGAEIASTGTGAVTGVAAPSAGALSAGAGGTILGGGTGATALGTGSKILGGATDASRELSPILGGAAQSQANARNLRDQANYRNFITNEGLPSSRLKTSVGASKVANFSPVSASWGGPGSGLKGGIVKFSGGAANPNLISPETKQQAQDVVHQMLMKQMGREEAPKPQDESTGEKILGGAATGTSILGGVGRFLKHWF